MVAKRKISIRKVLRAFVTLVVTTGCLVAVLGASKRQQAKTLKNIKLDIKNDHYKFLDKQTLWNDLVERKGLKEGETKLSKLNIQEIESSAYKSPWVAEAQAYVDNQHNLHIYVTQHVPVARIFCENGQSYYLDASLNLLPLSELFTYYTTIVTNVPDLGNDTLNKNLRAQIVKLVKFVERDTFWSAQIAQISVTPGREFELTPVLGTQKILFGDTTNMKRKFNNLFAFYKKVLNRVGWDRYEVLDLRYEDQIVASPSIPWKPPTKNAISNMDWVKSIMGNAPKDTLKPLVKATEKAMTVISNTSPAQLKKAKHKATVIKKEQPKNISVKEKNTPSNGKYIYQGNTNN